MSDNNSTQRLVNLLGFDPARRPGPTADLLKDVLGEITKERAEKAKEQIKVQLVEAVQLREQMHRLENDFTKNKQKFEKQLGKILNFLEAAANGRPAPVEEPTEGEGQPQQ